MKPLLIIIILNLAVSARAQRVGIGTTTPLSKLEVKDTIRSRVTVSSKHYNDTSQLMLRNRTAGNLGTDMIMSNDNERGLRISAQSDLPINNHDSIMHISPQARVGINRLNPQEELDVRGNVNVTGVLKINNNGGEDGQVLRSNGNGTMQWEDASKLTSSAPSTGFGVWGDCSTNGIISGYQPVADSASSGIAEVFGESVGISGEFAIVGSPYDNNSGDPWGAVHIYRYVGNKWVYMQKIAEGATNGPLFGASVSIAGDFLAIGCPGANSTQGAVSIYAFNGTTWVFMQKLTDATGATTDHFGSSVCLSGNRVIIGSPYDVVGSNVFQGSASVFQYNGINWVLMQKIIDPVGGADDRFGHSVSISGNMAIIGAPWDDNGSFDKQGSATVFRYNGTTWFSSIRTTNPSARANLEWGWSVGISGNSIIVGARQDQVGTNLQQGTVSFFDFNGVNWIYGGKKSNTQGQAGDRWGTSVAISGDYALVGAPQTDVGANIIQGAVTVLVKYANNLWQQLIQVTDPGGQAEDMMGNAVTIDASTKQYLIGASNFSAGRGKALFGKIN